VSVRVDGFAVTPAGNPLRVTFTLAVNAFRAFAVTATAWPVAPAVRVSVAGEAVRLKSAEADKGLDAWLPQPMMATGTAAARTANSDAGITRMNTCQSILPFLYCLCGPQS
jgi:hypothetical protein